MRLLMRNLLLAVTILCTAGLATACGSSIGSSVSSAVSSLTASSSPAQSTSSPPATVTSSTATVSSPPATVSSPPPSVTSSAPATSAAPAPVAQPSTSATEPPNGSGSTPIWIWILIGLVVLIVVTALIVRSVRRRAATAAGWRTKVIDVYAEGSALLDAMKIAATHGLAGDRAADAQWYDIQRRSDDLARTLYALREQAPDDEARALVADVLAALQSVRSAMESERADGTVGGPGAELVRSRLAAFEVSLGALRLAHYPQN